MKRIYRYPSGHAKRLKKAQKEEQEKMEKGSIKKFCFTIENERQESLHSASIQNVRSETNVGEYEVAVPSERCEQVEKTSSSEVISLYSSSSNSESEPNNLSVQQKNSFEITEDPALWSNISDQLREYFVTHQPNLNLEMLPLIENTIGNTKRFLTEKHFYRTMKNGEKLKREWLILSPSNYSVYCYVCKLFSTCNSALATTGFCDWKHASERLSEHENSISHSVESCTDVIAFFSLLYQLYNFFSASTHRWNILKEE